MIALVTFGILATELAIIRWSSSQIRIFAYFNNIVLIGAFLGMGAGVALGRRLPGLIHLALPVFLLVAGVFAFSEELHLVQMPFPDRTISLWGGEIVRAQPWVFVKNLSIMLAIYSVIIVGFICLGAPLGYLLSQMGILKAYSADLLGSLCGVLTFAVLAWAGAGPAVWLACGLLPFVVLLRRVWPTLLAIVVVVLGAYSRKSAQFSPYNRIQLNQASDFSLTLEVNRDFHQYLHDLSDGHLARLGAGPTAATFRALRQLYDLPFVLAGRRGSAVIVGAGTGNDVQAALRNGYRQVVSVDIDGTIIGIGRSLHPEKPYSDPRVVPVINDARAFFERETATKYDLV